MRGSGVPEPGWMRRIVRSAERWLAWAPVAAAVVVFARFVQLGWYAQPQADDFDFSVLYTRYGFWDAQLKWYYGWSGRYFSNAAVTLAVGALDAARPYWVIPTLLFAFVFWSCYWVFHSSLGGNRMEAFAGATVASALLVATSPARADAYYWAAGGPLYPLANSVLLFWLVAGARLFAAEEAVKRRREAAILVGLAFVIIGCNETSMLVLDAIVAGACAIALLRRRSTLPHWIVVLTCCALFSAFVITAPGNLVRESFMFHRGDLQFASVMTTVQTMQLLWAWITQPVLIVATLLAWPFARRGADRARACFPSLAAGWVPAAAFVSTCALVWLSVFPSWWSKGSVAVPRTLNVSYATFLVGWGIACAFLAALRIVTWRSAVTRLSTALLSVALVYLLLTQPTYQAALRDLKTAAPLYRQQLLQRYALIREAKGRGDYDVSVEPISNPPSQFYVLDLLPCTEGWPNSSYAEHFGLRSIRPRGAPMGSCGAVPEAAQKVLNPYSMHLFRDWPP